MRQNCGGIYKAGYHYRYFSLEEIYSYDANMDCVWVLVAPERWLIKVSFSYICIEWETNCNYDFLEVIIIIFCDLLYLYVTLDFVFGADIYSHL